MQQSKTFLNAKLLFSIAILFSFFTIGCTDNTTDPTPEPILIKGITQKYDGNRDSFSSFFEYTGNKLTKATSYEDKDDANEFIFVYNSNGIDNVTVYESEDNSIIKLQFEYNGNNLSKIIATENGIVISSANYIYLNGKLTSVSTVRYEDNKVSDSICSFDFTTNRPGIIETYYFDDDSKKLRLTLKEKFIYQNGNLLEKYELNKENNKWQLREKRTFNNEKIVFASIVDFILLLNDEPYIPGNVDKNDFLNYESYYNYRNDETFEEAQLFSKDVYIYKRDNNSKITSIDIINEEYCGSTSYNTYVTLKY